MREIKFRAWVNGQMVYSPTVAEMMFEDGHYFGHLGCHEGTDIMQYTGLKDKNGVEIYEGDLLEYYDPEDTSGPRTVVWDRFGWGIHYSTWPDGFNAELTSFHTDSCIVIGNIYENPELIK